MQWMAGEKGELCTKMNGGKDEEMAKESVCRESEGQKENYWRWLTRKWLIEGWAKKLTYRRWMERRKKAYDRLC